LGKIESLPVNQQSTLLKTIDTFLRGAPSRSFLGKLGNRRDVPDRYPKVMGGKPCIRGMRVTAGTIAGLLASGHRKDDILRLFLALRRKGN
jgi:hypothetical protein